MSGQSIGVLSSEELKPTIPGGQKKVIPSPMSGSTMSSSQMGLLSTKNKPSPFEMQPECDKVIVKFIITMKGKENRKHRH